MLDLVHIDLCSMGDKIIGGALYFVTFVDDHSKKLWVYSPKINDKVLNVLKQWVVEVKRETKKKLKYTWLDNIGEYCGPFEIFCKTNGIKLEKSVHKIP
jgi:hypothetical protein